jgi:hypothetical protein
VITVEDVMERDEDTDESVSVGHSAVSEAMPTVTYEQE